jgi:hypothetical protein
LNNKGIVILAQSNISTDGISSSQSDNQTTGVGNNNPHSNLPPKFASDKFDGKYNNYFTESRFTH